MSYKDLLPIINDLLCNQQEKVRMYSEDEIVEVLCNDQLTKQLASLLNRNEYNSTVYFAFKRNDETCYLLSYYVDDELETIRNDEQLDAICRDHTIRIQDMLHDACDVCIEHYGDGKLCIKIKLKN